MSKSCKGQVVNTYGVSVESLHFADTALYQLAPDLKGFSLEFFLTLPENARVCTKTFHVQSLCCAELWAPLPKSLLLTPLILLLPFGLKGISTIPPCGLRVYQMLRISMPQY